MTSQHTPGPWNVSGNDEDGNIEVWVDGGIPIASVRWMSNARLIAAAPDLLQALAEVTDALAQQMTFHRVPEGGWSPEDEVAAKVVERARDVIDKAEGRDR